MGVNYFEINSRALNLLVSVKKHTSSIDNKLRALVELRVSQVKKMRGQVACIIILSILRTISGTD